MKGFFSGHVNNEKSSKRLVGLVGSFVALLLCAYVCIKMVNNDHFEEVVDLLDSLFTFCGALLGLGLVEIFKKNENSDNSKSS